MCQFFLVVLALLAAPRMGAARDAQVVDTQTIGAAGTVTVEVLDAVPTTRIDIVLNGTQTGRLLPDKRNKDRLTAIVRLRPGDTGTVNVSQRGETTTLDLVSDGRPAPAGGRKVADYKDGGRVTLTADTLGLSTAGVAAVIAAQNPRGHRFRIGYGVSGGFGTASLVGAVEKGCAEIRSGLGADACAGTDRGPAGMVGGEIRANVGRLDFGVYLGVTKPSGFDKEFSGRFGSEMFRGTGSANLWLLDSAFAVGVSPNDRFRVYTRGGPSYFNATRLSTLTFRNQTDRVEEQFSAFAPRVFVGLDVRATRNIWLSGQGGRTWMRKGTWREQLSALMVVMKVLFGIPAW